jgi:hypothetical protein
MSLHASEASMRDHGLESQMSLHASHFSVILQQF